MRPVSVHRLLLASALVALALKPGLAQNCVGLPAFADGILRISGTASASNAQSAMHSELTLGSPVGPFLSAGVGLGRQRADGARDTTIGASLGFTIPTTETGRSEVCPFLGYASRKGPTVAAHALVNDSVRTRSRTYIMGVALGGVAFERRFFTLVPFVSAAVVGYTDFREGRHAVDTLTGNSLLFSIGSGVRVLHGVTLRPSFDHATGPEKSRTAVSLSASVAVFSSRASLRSAGQDPCIDGECMIVIEAPDEMTGYLREYPLHFRVLEGCPRGLGDVERPRPSSGLIGAGSNLEALPFEWAEALRNVRPILADSAYVLRLPKFPGRRATLVYFHGATPLHVSVFDFGERRNQTNRVPFIAGGDGLYWDVPLVLSDVAAIRRCR